MIHSSKRNLLYEDCLLELQKENDEEPRRYIETSLDDGTKICELLMQTELLLVTLFIEFNKPLCPLISKYQ